MSMAQVDPLVFNSIDNLGVELPLIVDKPVNNDEDMARGRGLCPECGLPLAVDAEGRLHHIFPI